MHADPDPKLGRFYRSDNFSFAAHGVPALYAIGGTDDAARGSEWGRLQLDDYYQHRYHRPQDVFVPEWDLRGTADDLRLSITALDSCSHRAAVIRTGSAAANFAMAAARIAADQSTPYALRAPPIAQQPRQLPQQQRPKDNDPRSDRSMREPAQDYFVGAGEAASVVGAEHRDPDPVDQRRVALQYPLASANRDRKKVLSKRRFGHNLPIISDICHPLRYAGLLESMAMKRWIPDDRSTTRGVWFWRAAARCCALERGALDRSSMTEWSLWQSAGQSAPGEHGLIIQRRRGPAGGVSNYQVRAASGVARCSTDADSRYRRGLPRALSCPEARHPAKFSTLVGSR